MHIPYHTIATQIFNYKHVLHELNIDDFKSKPPDYICASSPFIYNPAGHVITRDLKIINNTSLQDVLAKGPKYRESKSINWKHNFKMIMDSVEDYVRQWAKREKEDFDTLSEWMKSVRSLIQIRIKKISGSMSTRSTSTFKDPNVLLNTCFSSMTNILLSPPTRPLTILFLCVNHIT